MRQRPVNIFHGFSFIPRTHNTRKITTVENRTAVCITRSFRKFVEPPGGFLAIRKLRSIYISFLFLNLFRIMERATLRRMYVSRIAFGKVSKYGSVPKIFENRFISFIICWKGQKIGDPTDPFSLYTHTHTHIHEIYIYIYNQTYRMKFKNIRTIPFKKQNASLSLRGKTSGRS